MKKVKLFFFLVCLFFCTKIMAQTPPTNGIYLPAGIPLAPSGFDRNNPFLTSNWKLVFFDEFNVDGYLDPNKWTTYDPGPGWGTGDAYFGNRNVGKERMSMYKDENVRVAQGSCILTLKKESCYWSGIDHVDNGVTYYDGNYYDYSSGIIATKPGAQMFEQGMFEARIAMGKGYFSHQNFWTWPDNEIDMSEFAPYKGRTHVELNLHNNYFKQQYPNYASLEDCGAGGSTGAKFDETFHVYTAIWDKYYIYFYIDHSLKKIYSKFLFNNTNNYAGRYEDFNFPTVTNAGYYWLKECFMTLNHGTYIELTNFIDSKSEGGVGAQIYKQDKGLPTEMWIDWVRVYQRYGCDEDNVIMSSDLTPYETLSPRYNGVDPNGWTVQKSITLGTQSSQQWTNIVPEWDLAHYNAKVIDLLPNFVAYPAPDKAEGKLRGQEFAAKQCPYVDFPGYITPENVVNKPDTTVEPFDCNDLDTAAIMGIVASGDINAVNQLYFLLDSLGCPGMIDYINQQQNNTNKTVRKTLSGNMDDSLADQIELLIYPNPAKESAVLRLKLPKDAIVKVTIRDIAGRALMIVPGKKYVRGIQTLTLNIGELPPGIYTTYISINNQDFIKKLSVK